MKTLQVIEGLGGGGAERLLVDVTLELAKRGVATSVIHRGGALAAELGEMGFQIPEGGRFLGWRRPLVERPANVIHCHSLAPLFGARAAARRTGAKLVFTVHGWSADKFGPAAVAMRLVRPDAVIAVSQGVQDRLAQQGIDSQILTNAVPDHYETVPLPARAPRAGRTTHFVLVGRFAPQKRHDLLLEAFSTVVASGHDVHLHLVGEGALRGELVAQAQRLGLEHYVTFHGFVDPHPILAASDCYVSSSDYEGLSLAQLEAMMSGLPLVVTATEGVDEVVDSSNGIVVPVGDADALAGGMIEFLTDPSPHMGEASRAKYEQNYAFEGYVNRLVELYRRL